MATRAALAKRAAVATRAGALATRATLATPGPPAKRAGALAKHAGALAVGLAIAVAPTPARAGDADDLLAWLDADAPLVATVQPALFERVTRLATSWFAGDLPSLATEVTDAGAALSAIAGFDIASVEAWRAAGLDPDSPVAMSMGSIDEARTGAVFDALFSFKDWNDRALRSIRKVYWRGRIVARVRNVDAAVATLARVATGSAALHLVSKQNARKVSMTLGGSARKATRVYERLRKRNVLAIGWIEGIDAIVAVRIDKKRRVAIVDIVASFAGVPTVWPRDSRRVLGVIERNPGNSALPARMKAGAGRIALGKDIPDAIVWLQPGRMLDAATAMGRHRALRALAHTPGTKRERKRLHAAATADIARCSKLRPVATKGAFSDLALSVELTGSEAVWRAGWGLRATYPLAAALVAADDGLLARGPVADAVIAGGVLLSGANLLRGLPRPPVMHSASALAEAVVHCGGGSGFVASRFGWPQLVALALDEATAEPTIGAVIAGVRNAAFVVRQLASDDALDASAVVSMTAEARIKLGTLLDALLGSAKTRTVDRRAVAEWSLGEATARAFAWPLSDAYRAVGLATQETAATRMVRASGPPAKAAKGAAKGAASAASVAWLYIDTPALLTQLGDLEPGAADTFRAVRKHVGPLRADLTVDDGLLESRFTLELR